MVSMRESLLVRRISCHGNIYGRRLLVEIIGQNAILLRSVLFRSAAPVTKKVFASEARMTSPILNLGCAKPSSIATSV
jgi:hypothetical protein